MTFSDTKLVHFTANCLAFFCTPQKALKVLKRIKTDRWSSIRIKLFHGSLRLDIKILSVPPASLISVLYKKLFWNIQQHIKIKQKFPPDDVEMRKILQWFKNGSQSVSSYTYAKQYTLYLDTFAEKKSLMCRLYSKAYSTCRSKTSTRRDETVNHRFYWHRNGGTIWFLWILMGWAFFCTRETIQQLVSIMMKCSRELVRAEL